MDKRIIVSAGIALIGYTLWLRRKRHIVNPNLPDSIAYVFRGNIVHCINITDDGFKVLDDYIIGVRSDGKIAFVEEGKFQAQLALKFGFKESSVISLGKKYEFIKKS